MYPLLRGADVSILSGELSNSGDGRLFCPQARGFGDKRNLIVPFSCCHQRRAQCAARQISPCYKIEMTKTIDQWLLFKFEHGEFTALSKPFKTKERAEKERMKYSERQRKSIGLGVIRIKK